MDQGWRFSVRLDPVRARRVRELAAQGGCVPSDLLRRALDHYVASGAQRLSATKRAEINASTAGMCQIPIASRQGQGAASAASPHQSPTEGVKAATSTEPTQAVAASSCPPSVAELESQYRAFGAQIWTARRVLFLRTVVAAKIAQSNNENPRDTALYAELLKLGQQFGLFN